jgi:hypothetical protein
MCIFVWRPFFVIFGKVSGSLLSEPEQLIVFQVFKIFLVLEPKGRVLAQQMYLSFIIYFSFFDLYSGFIYTLSISYQLFFRYATLYVIFHNMFEEKYLYC